MINPLNELSAVYLTHIAEQEADNTPEDVKTRVMQIVKAIRYKARKEGGNIVKAFNDYMGGQSGIGAAERQMVKQRLGLQEENEVVDEYIDTVKKVKKAELDQDLKRWGVEEDYEEKKKGEVLGALKKKKGDFKKRYGKDAPDVMYAVAAKTAKKKGDTSKSDDRYAYEEIQLEGNCEDCGCKGCGKNPCVECGEDHHKLGEKKVSESFESVVDYFYSEGINEEGIDIIIGEVGLDELVDFITDAEFLDEERAARKMNVRTLKTLKTKTIPAQKEAEAKRQAQKKGEYKEKSKKTPRVGAPSYATNVKHVAATVQKAKKATVQKAKKDHDGDGKVETPKAEHRGSRNKAIAKAVVKAKTTQPTKPVSKDGIRAKVKDVYDAGVKRHKKAVQPARVFAKGVKAGVKSTVKFAGKAKKALVGERYLYYQFSNWREDLREIADDIPETEKEMDVKITEKKVKNKIVINPVLGEEIKKMGGELLEMAEVEEQVAAGGAVPLSSQEIMIAKRQAMLNTRASKQRQRTLANMKADKKEDVKEGDFWHPDPEKDRRISGQGNKQRAREDGKGTNPIKAMKDYSKSLKPGESYMDFAKRKERKEEIEQVEEQGLDKYDRHKRMIRHKQDKYGRNVIGADYNLENERKAQGWKKKLNKEDFKTLTLDKKRAIRNQAERRKKSADRAQMASDYTTSTKQDQQVRKMKKVSEDKAFDNVVSMLRKKHGESGVLTKDSPKSKAQPQPKRKPQKDTRSAAQREVDAQYGRTPWNKKGSLGT